MCVSSVCVCVCGVCVYVCVRPCVCVCVCLLAAILFRVFSVLQTWYNKKQQIEDDHIPVNTWIYILMGVCAAVALLRIILVSTCSQSLLPI